jgi:hypothetical protein
MPARIGIRKGVDSERGRMRCHVQTVRQQRHRAEQDARRNFHDHHRRGHGDHYEGSRLARPAAVLAEGVIVLETLEVRPRL